MLLFIGECCGAEMSEEKLKIETLWKSSADVFTGTLKSHSRSIFYGNQRISAKFQVDKWYRGGFYGINSHRKKVEVECNGHCQLVDGQLYLVFLNGWRLNELPIAIIPLDKDDEIKSILDSITEESERIQSEKDKIRPLVPYDDLFYKIVQNEFKNGGTIRVYQTVSDSFIEYNYMESAIYDSKQKRDVKFNLVSGILIGKKRAPYIRILYETRSIDSVSIEGSLSNGRKFKASIDMKQEIKIEFEDGPK
jgi:hypothetical protein